MSFLSPTPFGSTPSDHARELDAQLPRAACERLPRAPGPRRTTTQAAALAEAFPATPRESCAEQLRRLAPRFREEDCGGVWDGNGVVSDADPGL